MPACVCASSSPSSPSLSALAREAVIVALDFETTGAVAGWPVEAWQVGVVCLRGGRVAPHERVEYLLRVAPDRPFNPHAPGRHGQLRDELARTPDLAARWPELHGWLSNRPVAAHNAGTERTILRRAAPLHRYGPWIDTLRLVRRTYPRLASAALEDVVATLGLTPRLAALSPDRAPHDAFHDALACAVLLEHFLTLPGWEQVTVRALVEMR
jgi:DNA polymerase III subunit epsilon